MQSFDQQLRESVGECPGSFRLRDSSGEYVGAHPLRRTDRAGAMIFLCGGDVLRAGLDPTQYVREYLKPRGSANGTCRPEATQRSGG